MSLYGLIKPNGLSGFGYGSTAEDVTSGVVLEGQKILVTGCNSGIGYETMRVLAMRGAFVIGTARSREKAESACRSVGDRTLGLPCDLSNPDTIRGCAARVKDLGFALDAIVCNAGIMALPRLELIYGHEAQFFINHIGHFILVTELLESLRETGRIVVLSSAAHWMAPAEGVDFENLRGEKAYRAIRAYGQSKMANLLFAKELARRFAGTARTANAVHPGISMTTNLTRYVALPGALKQALSGLLTPVALKSIAEAAATSCYAAAHPAMQGISGEYLADSNLARPRRDADDAKLAARLWERSARISAEI